MLSSSKRAFILLSVALVAACTEPSSNGPSDGGASPPTDAADRSDGSLDASLDAGFWDAAEDAQDSGPFDGGGSDPDWEPLAEPLNQCDFQMATNPAAVEPIVWQDCPGVPSENGCRYMRLDWSDERRRLSDAVSTRRENCFVVAEADGEVRNAFFLEELPCVDCFPPILFGLNDDQFSLDLRSFESCDQWASYHDAVALVGAVGGPVAAALSHERVPPGRGFRSHVSNRWIAEWDVAKAVSVVDRETLLEQQVFGPGDDPDGLVPREVTVSDEGVFFVTSGGSNRSGIMSWAPVAGTRRFQRWPGDTSRGAGNFSTDGTDMVWTLSEGRDPEFLTDGYPVSSIMTAPFTTDPEVVQATGRRLRSDPARWLIGHSETFVVGCGYAARAFGGDGDVIIVRLSDGAAWIPESRPEFTWVGVVGVTCDEFFGLAAGPIEGAPLTVTIARMRLDALGEPLPPD